MLLTHAFSLLLYNASSFNTIMNTLTWYLCLVRLQMPSPKSVNIDVTIGELYKWRWDTDLYHRGHGERGERAVEHLHITHITSHITHIT